MIPTTSLFDELIKIAEEAGPGPLYYMPPTQVPEEDRFITKDKLKRALIVAGLAGAGAGIGHGAAGLVRHFTGKLSPEKAALLARYAPAVTGAMALPLGWIAREQARQTDDYIAYGRKLRPQPQDPNA